jgi:uncharacterized protein (TIGR02246 family)
MADSFRGVTGHVLRAAGEHSIDGQRHASLVLTYHFTRCDPSQCAEDMRITLSLSVLLLLTAAQADEPRAWSYDSMRQGQLQSETPSAQSTDDQQIAALLAKMVDRWNAHDIEGYMEVFWNSPDLLCVTDGEEIMGWANALASYQRGYPNRDAMGTVREERTLIQPVKADVAFAMDWWRASFGPNSHSVCATSTYFLRKFQDGWKIAACHTSFVEP